MTEISSTETRSGDHLAGLSAAEADQSAKFPALFFLGSALVWLVLGTLLTLATTVQLFWPGFLNTAWLSYGRLHPAATNALIYGFALQGGIAIFLWLTVRLGRGRIQNAGFGLALGAFWNLGLTIGTVAVLLGGSTGYPWLEMPRGVSAFLLLLYLLLGAWLLTCHASRAQRKLYVSQWYVLAAVLWFGWIYLAAQALLLMQPARGVLQGLVNLWYGHNLVFLWLSLIGLALVYYLVPKIVARPLQNAYLALFAFGLFLVCASFGGIHAGGPMPKWISSVSIVGTVLALLGLAAIVLNLHATIADNYHLAASDIVFRFVLLGLACWVMAMLLDAVVASRSGGELVEFTLFTVGVRVLQVFGFFTALIAAFVYYAVPRMAGAPAFGRRWADLHFWMMAGGVGLATVAFLIGGLFQGAAMNSFGVPYVDVARLTVPFTVLASLGLAVVFCANMMLLIQFLGLLAISCVCGCMPSRTDVPAVRSDAEVRL